METMRELDLARFAAFLREAKWHLPADLAAEATALETFLPNTHQQAVSQAMPSTGNALMGMGRHPQFGTGALPWPYDLPQSEWDEARIAEVSRRQRKQQI